MFGFAQPIQRRLPIMGAPQQAMPAASTATAPQAAPPPSGISLDQIKSGLQRIGLGSPVPSTVGPIPSIAAPAMPSGGGIEDPSAAISSGVNSAVSGMNSGAASAAGDALADSGAGIGDFLAAFFGG